MARLGKHLVGAVAVAAGVSALGPARAASLEQVNDWGASGVPSYISMYIYVPDQVAPNPPILVVSHYCSGSASAVFGQVQGGGIVQAADDNGFILLFPQTSNNCWDVGTTKSLTHDGGGDTHAVAQMVKYAITEYQANADRVYATGDSGGGMMTEALLAVYPELFKGGSAFAGVPAGCWAVGNMTDGQWSSACAGGTVTHTAAEWSELVQGMYPGYAGPRPRVQLFHGDADSTIDYANHTEAIKQWTGVLGLSESPTTTDTVTLGSHQATRQRWENSCGYVVLDAFTSVGGDHGPSDAIFDSEYVVPFFGLDSSDPTDPQIAQCGEGGAGGAPGTGGAGTGGATSGAGTTQTGGAGAGATGNAGAPGAAGGTLGAAGNIASGGAPGSAGVSAGGGVAVAGGATASAGSPAAGGSANSPAGGGSVGVAAAAGGQSSAASASGTSGASAQAGAGSAAGPARIAGGCSSTAGSRHSPGGLLALVFGALFARRRRHRNVLVPAHTPTRMGRD